MSRLRFSLSDYQQGLQNGRYTPPDVLCPYFEVDPVLYRQQGSTDQRRGDLKLAVDELRKRTTRGYFSRTYPLQARTLDYSARAFPAYRFILPEVMTEDWLAIVDWGKFQRDHVLHQPLCGYVALKLLEGDGSEGPLQLPDGKTLLDSCVEWIMRWQESAYIREFLVGCGMSGTDPILSATGSVARFVWRIFFREAAYVAALFHDLGYPWQYAERVQGNLDGMNTPAVKQNRGAGEVVRLFGHRLLLDALQGYQAQNAARPSGWHDRVVRLTDAALKKTHGLPGALGFLHLNDCVRRFPSRRESPLHLLCVEWVAAAIMMHDMCKIYWGKPAAGSATPDNPFMRLSFNMDPVSAFVTLVDVIQDFERPAAEFGRAAGPTWERVTVNYETACLATELESSGRSLTIRYMMDSPCSRAIKQRCLVKERREYFDPQYGYLDMGSLGFEKVELLAS